jgi:bacterioferritin-associated ferredoxin
MYVCVCNAVTETTIRQAVDDGVRTLRELRLHTGCSMTCGTCEDLAEEVLVEAIEVGSSNLVHLEVAAA